MSTYDQQTGDGNWYEKTVAILCQSIKEAKAESTAEPSNMRSVDGADRAGLRPENCRR